jgi:VanZ family protein
LTSKEASPYLRAALGTINPFDLWYYALLAIAFATLHKKQPSKGVPFVAVVYLLTLLMALLGGASQGLVPKM